MVAHDRLHVRAAASQLEHGRTAVAEPDRGDALGVDVLARRDRVEPGDGARPLPVRIGEVLGVRQPGVLDAGADEMGAVHVGADRDVPLLRELACDRLVHAVGDAERAVHHEHRRRRAGTGRERGVPAQARPLVVELDAFHAFEHALPLAGDPFPATEGPILPYRRGMTPEELADLAHLRRARVFMDPRDRPRRTSVTLGTEQDPRSIRPAGARRVVA